MQSRESVAMLCSKLMHKSLKQRIVSALKRESGLRLTPAEAICVANKLGVIVPEKLRKQPRSKHVKPVANEPVEVAIRWMIRRDMPELLNIEHDSFPEPWKEDDFIRQLRQRNCIGMVADHKEQVVGFMIYELHKDQLHVLKLAVHKDHRAKTIGTQLLEKLKSKLSQQRRTRIYLELRESNIDAQIFMASNGFRAISVLENHYNTGEGALQFSFNVVKQEQFQLQAPKGFDNSEFDYSSDDSDEPGKYVVT
jgi:ribosomal-protein-alanine N-acetyltransferase